MLPLQLSRTITEQEKKREGRQTEVRAAAATILHVVSVLFLSQLISLYLLILIQEQKKTGKMPRIVAAKVHQGKWRRLDTGGEEEEDLKAGRRWRSKG